MSESQRDPALHRAAAGVRAIAILLLLPGIWIAWEVIPDVFRLLTLATYGRQFERAVTEVGVALVVLLPGALLLIVAMAVRRGRAWAVIIGYVVVGMVTCVLLLIHYGLANQWIYEYGHPARGYEKNLRRVCAMVLATVILLAATIRCLLDLHRASIARKLRDGPRGFEITLTQPVSPVDE